MSDDKLSSLVLTSALNFILNKIILGYFSCGIGVWSSGGGGDGGNGRGGGGNGRINLIGYGTGIGESFVICAFLPYKIPTDGSLTVCSGGGGGGGGGGC